MIRKNRTTGTTGFFTLYRKKNFLYNVKKGVVPVVIFGISSKNHRDNRVFGERCEK